MEIGEGAEAGELFGRESELERFLDQNDELGERERIEAEIGGEADFLGGHLESRAEGATPAGLMVKVAGVRVTLPTELVISTVWLPALAVVVAASAYDAAVAPQKN